MVVSTVTSQLKATWLESKLDPFCVEFSCSPHVCMGFFQVWLPPTVQKCILYACYFNWCLLIDPGSECETACLFVSMWPCDGGVTYPGCVLPFAK